VTGEETQEVPQLTEPMTMITDYVLGVQLLIFFIFLALEARSQRSIWLWNVAFLMVAVGAFAGGTRHGFKEFIGEKGRTITIKLTVYSIGVASLTMLAGTVYSSVGPTVGVWIIGLGVIQFIGYAIWMVKHDKFIFVIVDYVPAMLAVLVLAIVAWIAAAAFAPWLVAGIVLTFVGAGIQAAKIAPSEKFNHNDLYHVVQMGAMTMLFLGVRLMADTPGW